MKLESMRIRSETALRVFENCSGPPMEKTRDDTDWKAYEENQDVKLKTKRRYGMDTRTMRGYLVETQEEYDALSPKHPGRIILCDRSFVYDTGTGNHIKNTQELHEVRSVATEVPTTHPRRYATTVSELCCPCKYCVADPDNNQCKYAVWRNTRQVHMQIDCLKPDEAREWVSSKASIKQVNGQIVNYTVMEFLPEKKQWRIECGGDALPPLFVNYVQLCAAKKLYEQSQTSVTPNSATIPNVNTTTPVSTSTQAAASEPMDTDEDEDDVYWTIKKVYLPSEILSDSPVLCDNENCRLKACCHWHEMPRMEEEWNTCLDCQQKPADSDEGFGGWPKETKDIPLEYMSQNLRCVMASECSATGLHYTRHKFPNLYFEKRRRRRVNDSY